MEKVCSLSTHQTVLLDELTTIEDELDRMLPQVGGHERDFSITDQLKQNKFLQTHLKNPQVFKTDANR